MERNTGTYVWHCERCMSRTTLSAAGGALSCSCHERGLEPQIVVDTYGVPGKLDRRRVPMSDFMGGRRG